MSGYRVVAVTVGALLGLGTIAASAEEEGGSRLCAITQLLECVEGDVCLAIDPEAVGAPRFLAIDDDGPRIRDPKADHEAPGSAVVHSDRIDGKLILQGTDPGIEDLRDGVAWTVAIAEDSGGMVLTAAGDNVAYVAFGDCLATP